MVDTLLGSLREHVLDESQSLAGLLRKCLVLGAETGSEALRQWARNELGGYSDENTTPEYRKFATPVISADTISGNKWASNMTYSILDLPVAAQGAVRDELSFLQPIEELEQLSKQSSISFANPGLTFAQQIWNQELGPFQRVMNLRFSVSPSLVSGVLGQVRTRLVEMVADLTANTPLTELPPKDLVDAAVNSHIGTQYTTVIQAPTNAIGIGNGAISTSNGVSVDEAIKLLEAVKRAAAEVADRKFEAEVLEAADDLKAELASKAPDTGAVVKKAGKLKSIVARISGTTLNGAASGAVGTIISMAMGGMFA